MDSQKRGINNQVLSASNNPLCYPNTCYLLTVCFSSFSYVSVVSFLLLVTLQQSPTKVTWWQPPSSQQINSYTWGLFPLLPSFSTLNIHNHLPPPPHTKHPSLVHSRSTIPAFLPQLLLLLLLLQHLLIVTATSHTAHRPPYTKEKQHDVAMGTTPTSTAAACLSHSHNQPPQQQQLQH